MVKKRGLRYSRINLVAGKIGNALIGSMIYRETMESEFFEEWFREILLRDIEKLEKRVLIVIDNARFHRKNILEKIIEGTGHCLLFLPPYSPDLNPIEKLWANMKKKLAVQLQTEDTLILLQLKEVLQLKELTQTVLQQY